MELFSSYKYKWVAFKKSRLFSPMKAFFQFKIYIYLMKFIVFEFNCFLVALNGFWYESKWKKFFSLKNVFQLNIWSIYHLRWSYENCSSIQVSRYSVGLLNFHIYSIAESLIAFNLLNGFIFPSKVFLLYRSNPSVALFSARL